MSVRAHLTRLPFWIFSWLLYYSGFLKILSRVWSSSGPTILAYHRILETEDGEAEIVPPGVALSSRSFRAQIDYVSREYRVVSLEELVRMIGEEEEVRRVAVITFDDGWRDNYTNAYPILLQHEVTATIFLVTDYVGTTRRFWPDRMAHVLAAAPARKERIPHPLRGWIGFDSLDLPVRRGSERAHALIEKLKGLPPQQRDSFIEYLAGRTGVAVEELEERRRMLTWEEVKEMSASGMSFGSHTQTHPIMTTIPIDEARNEILNSKAQIEECLGRECKAFAYPNGDWNGAVRELVVASDYECACAVDRTRSDLKLDPYTLRRIVIHEGYALGASGRFSLCVFALKTSGLFHGFMSWLRRGEASRGEAA